MASNKRLLVEDAVYTVDQCINGFRAIKSRVKSCDLENIQGAINDMQKMLPEIESIWEDLSREVQGTLPTGEEEGDEGSSDGTDDSNDNS